MMTHEYVPAFCVSLNCPNDFAFVENLSEITGLFPFLQSLKVIVECSILTYSKQIGDLHDRIQYKYVQRHLINTSPEIAPTLLGCRCLGCDGNEWKTVFPGTARSDRVKYMLWVPCPSTGDGISLDLIHSKIFEILFRSVRRGLLSRNNVTDLKEGPRRDLIVYDSDEKYQAPIVCSYMCTHPFVFLPFFVRSWNSNRDLSELHYIPDDKYNADFVMFLYFR